MKLTLRQVRDILSVDDSFRIYIGDFDGGLYCAEQSWCTEFYPKDFPKQLLDYEVDCIVLEGTGVGGTMYLLNTQIEETD